MTSTTIEGMKLYIERLRGVDFTDDEIKIMCRDNPAALLGLPPLTGAGEKFT